MFVGVWGERGVWRGLRTPLLLTTSVFEDVGIKCSDLSQDSASSADLISTERSSFHHGLPEVAKSHRFYEIPTLKDRLQSQVIPDNVCDAIDVDLSAPVDV